MKKLFVLGLFLASLVYFPQAAFSEGGKIESLRGDKAINAMSESTPWKKWPISQAFTPNYDEQPPLITHPIEGDKINVGTNKCLKCHETISSAHFTNQNGNVLDKVDSRYYICTLCHSPQVGAQPLVENTFEIVSN